MNELVRGKHLLSKSPLLFAALGLTGLSPALAQVKPAPKPAVQAPVKPAAPKPAAPKPATAVPAAGQPKATPEGAVPGNPDYKAGQPEATAQPPAPPALPPAVWDPVSAQDLVYYIKQIGVEGLNPADYDPEGLEA